MQLSIRIALIDAKITGCNAGKMGLAYDNPYDPVLDRIFYEAYNEGFARGRSVLN